MTHKISVRFEDHRSRLDTEMEGTEEEIKAHYIGNLFDVGGGKMDRAISIAFIVADDPDAVDDYATVEYEDAD